MNKKIFLYRVIIFVLAPTGFFGFFCLVDPTSLAGILPSVIWVFALNFVAKTIRCNHCGKPVGLTRFKNVFLRNWFPGWTWSPFVSGTCTHCGLPHSSALHDSAVKQWHA